MSPQLTFFVSALFVLLSACAGSSGQQPSRQFYHLQPLALQAEGEANLTLPLVLIKPAALAPLLQQPALIVLSEPQQVYLSHTHHWAEELDTAISRNLQLELNASEDKAFRARTGYRADESVALQLQLDVDSFYADGDRQQVLNVGSFSLYRDQKLVYRKAYKLTQAYQGREYHHMVLALQQTQKRLAQLVDKAVKDQLATGAGRE